jgi:outer membrane usher protein
MLPAQWRRRPWLAARRWGWALVLLQGCVLAQAQAQSGSASDSATLFQRTFGQRQKPAMQQIALPVWLDEQEIGLVDAQIRPGRVDLLRQNLASLLGPRLQASVLEQIRPVQDGSERISLEELRQLGLEANYSPEQITLEIGLPLALRAVEQLSFKAPTNRSDDPSALRLSAQPWSFIGNLRWSMSSYESNNMGSQSGRLLLDSAGRWHDWVLEGNGTLDQQSFARQDLRLVRDWPQQAVRLSLGDVTPQGQGGGSALTLGGVRLARLFGLNPALDTQALPGTTLALAKGASVEVSVNGLPASTLRLGPGVYQLKDLPAFAGANAFELTITEPDGRVSRRSFDYFFNASLLRPGVDEYDLALGYPMTIRDNGRHYDLQQPMLSAWARRGWNDSLTAGASLQARSAPTMRAQLLGLDAVWASQIGDFASWIAQSRHQGFGGQAASLQWRWNSIQQKEASAHSWSVSLQGSRYSEGYAPVSSDLPGPALHDAGLRLSLLLGQGWRGQLSASLRHNLRTGDRSQDRSLTLQRRINRRWSLDTGLVLRHLNQQQDRVLSVQLIRSDASGETGNQASGRSWQSTASFQSQDQRLQWEGALSGRDSWLGSDTSWQLGASRIQARSEQANAVQARALHGRAEASLYLSENRLDSGASRLVEATLTSALVVSQDGGWNWSAPINDSAAQFKPYKGFEKFKLLVNPQGDYAALTSDRFGTPPLASLSAYVPRELQLDFEDLPSNRSLGQDRPLLLPAYRSVLVVPIGSNAQVQARGRLVDRNGKSLSLQPLLLLDGQGNKVMDLFTNRNGQFTSPQIPPGNYRLKRSEDDAEQAHFRVQDSDEGMLDIGTVQIQGDDQ